METRWYEVTPTKDVKIIKNGVWKYTLSKYDTELICATTEKQAKREFKENHGLKVFRNFSILDVTPDRGIKILHSYDTIYVFANGKKVLVWNNNANCDYPEDLTWERNIAEVFYAGIDAAKHLIKY